MGGGGVLLVSLVKLSVCHMTVNGHAQFFFFSHFCKQHGGCRSGPASRLIPHRAVKPAALGGEHLVTVGVAPDTSCSLGTDPRRAGPTCCREDRQTHGEVNALASVASSTRTNQCERADAVQNNNRGERLNSPGQFVLTTPRDVRSARAHRVFPCHC